MASCAQAADMALLDSPQPVARLLQQDRDLRPAGLLDRVWCDIYTCYYARRLGTVSEVGYVHQEPYRLCFMAAGSGFLQAACTGFVQHPQVNPSRHMTTTLHTQVHAASWLAGRLRNLSCRSLLYRVRTGFVLHHIAKYSLQRTAWHHVDV
jgi:hypothetical protein